MSFNKVLESDRLVYKPLDTSYCTEDYLRWMNDKDVVRYMEIFEDYTKSDLENYLLAAEKNEALLFWAIHIKENDKHIGDIKIDPVNRYHRYGEYGIMMGDKSEWRKGYASEATKTIIDYCFKEQGLRKITLGVVEDNLPAVNLYEKLGFVTEGIYKDHGKYDGRYCNILRMAIFNPGLMYSNRFILGTVQFGMDYGINNSLGKPSKQKVFEILDKAYEGNITELDSADAYGNAQKLIGEYIRSKRTGFLVNTKFTNGGLSISDQLLQTLQQLHLEKVNVYFFHRFEDMIHQNGSMNELVKLKEKGLIKKIGVSIYTNDEFLKAIQTKDIDVIQLPLNLLDNYSKRGDLVYMAKEYGKTLQVRSVFLQGLFFKEKQTWPHHLFPLFKYVSRLRQIASEYNLRMCDLALSYVLSKKEIDHIVIGVDSVEQLVSDLAVQKMAMDKELSAKIDAINVEEESLLYPYNWE